MGFRFFQIWLSDINYRMFIELVPWWNLFELLLSHLQMMESVLRYTNVNLMSISELDDSTS